MVWQDIVITIANLMFTYSLVYQVYHGFKNKKGYLTLTTSGLTCLGLFAIFITFLTLSLYFAAISSLINGILWLILFIQRIIYKK